jgi:hydrogenase nickel incorporation protein HypA/HybF
VHELSIADAVLQIVDRHAAGRRVTLVELRVGHLRQVVPDALTFAWQLVSEGSCAEGAELIVEQVPASVSCASCAADTTLEEFPARCMACGSLDVEVTGGEELLVDSLELEEAETEALTRSGG